MTGADAPTLPVREAGELPQEAWLVALSGLPKMGPARLLALTLLLEPRAAWTAVAEGRVLAHPGLVERMGADPAAVAVGWQRAAARTDVTARWLAHAPVTVAGYGRDGYPEFLASDLEPPAVLFTLGDGHALEHPRVAVVGTRRCTRYGFDVAQQIGSELAEAGVCVVSGLALGIDGAAHRGALAARPGGGAAPVGVVASGLDVVYPKRHRGLWDQVAAAGLLVSECPLGTSPEAWRFPARNRIIAALAQAVVVVESGVRGGSMYTVDQAIRRDVPVLAFPGPVRSPASAGTNKLLFEGAAMVRDSADILGALGLPVPRRPRRDQRTGPDGEGRRVLRNLGWEPASLDQLIQRTGLDLGPLSVTLAALERDGWVVRSGMWFERSVAPAPSSPTTERPR